MNPNSDDDEKGQPNATGAVPRPDVAASTTTGTGSALGIGCVIAVILYVLIAFAARWLAGIW